MTTPTAHTIIFAGGGTGGHIVPALAIADACRSASPAGTGVRTVHIGGERQIDRSMHAAALERGSADAVHHIPAMPFSVRPRGLASLLASWGNCVRTVRGIIKAERDGAGAVSLVAMGGYVAAPAVQAARAERCPVALVNLDAVAGLANRWVARRADRRFAVGAAPARPPGLDWTTVPPIVAPAFDALPAPRDARARFALDPERPTLLVTGGSQGARSINAFIAEMLDAEPGAFRDWQAIHQTGDDDRFSPEDLGARYGARGMPAYVARFIDDMPAAWAAADAAVGRAGAGTVAEAWASQTPTLFLPYPYHKDQHQRRNAEPLADTGAAILATDRIGADLNRSANGEMLVGLLRDPPTRLAIREALRTLGPAVGAATIARALLGR
jgi:UDP-N-acetylglucosamine--N-acetylmuramyl-(pentapeptide) pyrophosphoryl-undecaprenol N-acetylglucosamine transferase